MAPRKSAAVAPPATLGGDDEDYGAYEIDEDVLQQGGGGAHEKEITGDDGDDGDDDDDDEDNEKQEMPEGIHHVLEEREEEQVEELNKKKRGKFEALKKKKRAKVEESAVSTSTSQQLSEEQQYQLFIKHQPKQPDGSILATFLPRDFFVATHTQLSSITAPKGLIKNSKATPPLVTAIEVGLGGVKESKKLLAKTSEELGCPLVVILCPSAKRAAELINNISAMVHCKIAKLFAKHLKIPEQVEILGRLHFPIAIGTPNRVLKLLELGALCMKNTAVLLADLHTDEKLFNLLTLPALRDDFYKLIGSEYVQKDKAHFKVSLVMDA